MKKPYCSPDAEIKEFVLKEVILSSIVIQDETYAGGGVVIDPDEELEEP